MKRIGRSRASRLGAAAALVLVTGSMGLRSTSAALGPVIAITPNEINAGTTGDVGALNPSLSGRGETAGVYLASINFADFVGWAQFDVPGAEPAFDGRGITVSGDGCAALWVEPAPVIIVLAQTPPRVMLSRRCPGFEDRPVIPLPGFYDGRAQSALSHT
ncbi:MAG TPA: hypothetical protein VF065_06205, partial [Ilumatobacter sp.]